MTHRLRRTFVVLPAALLAVTGVMPTALAGPARHRAPTAPTAPTASARSPRHLAEAAYARMTRAERVGQLFLAGVTVTGSTSAERRDVRAAKAGNVFLRGRSSAGRDADRAVVSEVTPSATYQGVSPLVSTDQEGGEVQTLTGPGFSTMPTALAQGKLAPHRLRRHAARWGRQLAEAGVDLDLAPVADTVPKALSESNQPIGRFKREYGHTPAHVASHVSAVVRGLTGSAVATTVKHFPGLGRATGNTDTQRGVTDPTRRHDPFLRPYTDGVAAGAQLVMVSSATYPHIDADHLACFSRTVIGGMLRHDMAFTGVVMSDSFDAAAVSAYSPGPRALRFFRAGGTMLLASSPTVRTMARAVRHRMASHHHFVRTVRAAVLTNLTVKARQGLVTG